MSESQEYGINNAGTAGAAPGTAQTADGGVYTTGGSSYTTVGGSYTTGSGDFTTGNGGYAAGAENSQGTYSPAGAYTYAGTVYTSPPQQQFYSVPQYVQGTPVYNTQPRNAQTEEKKHRFSTPARILMWICGIAASITLLFGCAVLWVIGLRALQNTVVSPEVPESGSGYNSSDDDYGYGGGYGNFPGYGDFGSMLPYFDYGNPSSQEQSSAGLGITATAISLQFDVDGKYSAGLVIVDINEGSSFENTEVRVNDLIVAMDDTDTPDLNTLKGLLGRKQPGDTAEITIARYEKGIASTFDVTITLIDMDEQSEQSETDGQND